MIIISTIEAVDGEVSMVAEYMEVVCMHEWLGRKRGAVEFRFLHSEYKHVLC